jgi:hypothetical protein
MYTLDLFRLAPHDERTFINLGDNHNYGKRFELVCWVSGQDIDSFFSNGYLTLFYKFELKEMQKVGCIDVHQGIQKLKDALIKHKKSNTYRFYHSLICTSVKRFLSKLLDDYSYYLLYEKAALKIQRIWLNKFYDPSDKVCQKRLLREFNGMNNDMERERLESVLIEKI